MSTVSDIIVNWTPNVNPRVVAVQIRSRIVGTATWTEQSAAADPDLGTFRFTANAPATLVEVQMRYKMDVGVFGNWIDMTVMTDAVTIAYATIAGTPTTLSQISPIEGTKLGGIAAGATLGAAVGTNLTDASGLKVFTPQEILTRQGTAGDTAAVNGIPSATVTTNLAAASSALNTLNTVTIPQVNNSVTATAKAASDALAAAQTTLSTATATAQTAANQARTDAAAVSASLATEVANRATSEGNITTNLTNLTTTVAGNTSSITTEATIRANADSSLGIRIDTVTTNYQAGDTAVAASVTSEAATRSSADGALGTRIDTVTSTVGANTAAINSNYSTLANADSALSSRIDSVTSTANGNTSAIQSEATARSTADASLAVRASALESDFNPQSGSIDANPNFGIWPDGQTNPSGWGTWNPPTSVTRMSGPTGYFARIVSGTADTGLAQGNYPPSAPLAVPVGWYVMEADVALIAGSWNGSGLTLFGQRTLSFAAEPDSNGVVSATLPGRRTFYKLFRCEDPNWTNWHSMDNWPGCAGGNTAKTLDWYRSSFRAASAAEIAAGKPLPASSASARITDEYATRSTADGALSSRIDSLTSTVGGNTASISSEAITRAAADSTLSARTTSIESTYNTVSSGLVSNDRFANWPDGQGYPTGWVNWLADANFTAARIAGNGGSPYAVYTTCDAGGSNGFYYPNVTMPAGKIVVECTMQTVSGSVSGAGVTLEGIYNLDFMSDPDTNGQVGDVGNTTRTFSKTFDVTGRTYNVHAMSDWDGFGRTRASHYIKWFSLKVRAASAPETLTYANQARIATEETTRATADTAISSRVDSLTATVGTNTASIGSNTTALATTNQTVANLTTSVSSQFSGATPSGLSTIINNQRTNYAKLDWWKAGATIPWGVNGPATTNVITSFPSSSASGGLKGPDGSAADVWLATADSSGAQNGGWDGAYPSTLDPDKTYRFICPMAPLGTTSPRNMYWGTDNVAALNSASQQPNPYFAVAGSPPANRWYLFVGYIYPRNSTGKTNDGAGVWDTTTGQLISPGNNYCFLPSGAQPYTRAYQFYAYAGAQQAFARPLIELVDGSETNIANALALTVANATNAASIAQNAASITSVNTTLTNAQTALASTVTSLQATSASNNSLNNDPTFQVWPVGYTSGNDPSLWNNYDAGPSGATYLTRVAGKYGQGFAVRVAPPTNVNDYFAQAITPNIARGVWVVLEYEFTLNAGDLRASGAYYPGAFAINFSTERDATGAVIGLGVSGTTYQIKKLIQMPGPTGAVYTMTRWGGIGDVSVGSVDLTWYRNAIRAASQAEIDGQTVISNTLPALTARVTNAETAITTNNSAIATRTTTLEASINKNVEASNSNATFSNWPAGQMFPTYFGDAASAGAYLSKAPGLVGTYGLRYNIPANAGIEIFGVFDGNTGNGTGGAVGGFDPGLSKLGAGYYFVEADITLNSGSLKGSGVYVYLYGSQAAVGGAILNFAATPDLSGTVLGDGVPGTRYRWSVMYDFRSAGTPATGRMHPMPNWSGNGFGLNIAKDITFNSVVIRPASQQDVAGIGRDARLTTTEGAITSLNGKTSAYLQITAIAGNGRGQLTVHADGASGGVDIGGDLTVSGTAILGGGGPGANLVRNPTGINSTTVGWSCFEGSGPPYTNISTVDYFVGGRKGFNISKTDTGQTGAWGVDNISVTPGKSYVWRFSMAGSSATPGGIYHRINYGQTAFGPSNGVARTGLTDFLASGPINASPTTYGYVWTCPANVFFASPTFYNWGGGPTGLFFADVEFFQQATTATIADGAITANKLTIGSATGARTAIQPNLITVYDANNVLRVRLGVF